MVVDWWEGVWQVEWEIETNLRSLALQKERASLGRGRLHFFPELIVCRAVSVWKTIAAAVRREVFAQGDVIVDL